MIEDAIRELAEGGHEIVRAVMAGGTEKLATGTLELAGVRVTAGDEPEGVLAAVLDDVEPDAVVDLSDEPVLDARRRLRLAAIALERGVRYQGPDFGFNPPHRPRLSTKPTLAVISTGKRTGKTAVTGFAARTLAERGIDPVIVAMGRGGPADPEVLRGDEIELGPSDLIELVRAGKHAASDYIEDALLARVPTVGCRRCGGGLAGGVEISNVGRGVELANGLSGDICVLEGSGSAVPPAHADATILVVPASVVDEYVTGYFGPYRLLLSDAIIVSMCEEPFGSALRVSSLTDSMRATLATMEGGRRRQGEVEIVRTVFRPSPTRSVEGARVCVATTAPEAVGRSITRHLEDEHGCHVVGISHSLSNRARLQEELDDMVPRADVLLCEIKAAAVDVATEKALAAGLEVTYMDNVPVGVAGDDPEGAVERVADLALSRHGDRSS
ncbi:cyclic 2,3-diphosphoglycerate synthase [soil metagenome]